MNEEKLICVLCGKEWEPPWKNRCECGGMCTWGYELNKPLSWNIDEDGKWNLNPVKNKKLKYENFKKK